MPALADNASALAMFALFVAFCFAHILKPLIDYFRAGGGEDCHPLLGMGVSVVVYTVPVTFFLGVALLYARIMPAFMPPAALQRLAALAWVMAWATLLLGLPPLAMLFVGRWGWHE